MATRGYDSVNVLFTSVGRRVELLRAFRRAYDSLGLAGNIIATDIDFLAPALQVADQYYIVPRLTEPDYIPKLVEICRDENVHLVFPLIDPDIPVMAQHCCELEATGARLAVVPPTAAAITADKWLTVGFFRRLGLPVPHSWLPAQLEPARAEYPLFIKPRCGSASNGAYVVRDKNELVFFAGYVHNPIIQEFLPGPEITNDVICDLDSQVLQVVSRQRIEVRWGEVAKGVTVYDPIIIQACVRIAQALPAIGPITVQCMLKDGVAHFTEINARFGGGVPLGIAAGADAPRWLLARAAGIPVDIPPLGQACWQIGLYLTRCDDSFFLTEAQPPQLAQHFVGARSRVRDRHATS
jgi:carbamoyl-phosphate synthase large subunit